MRNLFDRAVNRYRIIHPFLGAGDESEGAFAIPSPTNKGLLRVIASSYRGWDHLSVSHERGIPCWSDMDFVYRLFFRENEAAYQLHVPPAEHLNFHPHCLHIWSPHDQPIPRPPAWMVAPSKGDDRQLDLFG